MDDFGSIGLCRKCRKRRPDEKQTKLILRARRKFPQTTLENLAKRGELDFCICPECQFNKSQSRDDVLEPEKGEDGLSYQDTGFQIIKRSVGPNTRISRPPWFKDDLAILLFLYSQSPATGVAQK